MAEVEYWFITRMYTLGILALTVAVVQVRTNGHQS